MPEWLTDPSADVYLTGTTVFVRLLSLVSAEHRSAEHEANLDPA